MHLIKKLSTYLTLPRLKKCPYCFSINILKNKKTDTSSVPMVEILPYDSYYKSLQDWILKKKFKCRNCKIKLGFFIHNQSFREAIIWLDFFVYNGVSKPFLEQKNYKFLKDTRKKNWSKRIFKVLYVSLTLIISFWAIESY